MILIISESNDVTTDDVVEWLNYYGKKFVRCNFSQSTSLDFLTISNSNLNIGINNLDDRVTKVWHRRGSLKFIPESLRNITLFNSYLKEEEESLLKSLEGVLKSKVKYIGSYLDEVENSKINNLLLAKKANLEIPDTLITTSKKKLFDFFGEKSPIITKDLRYPINISDNNFSLLSQGTFIVRENMIHNMDDNFAPTLFQKYIKKKYEVRIFFFETKLFPMAILSQKDTKTTIDFRNYNRKRPNRCVPVLLPKDIIKKIRRFIHLSKLTTGSIDIIVSTSNQYVFLEVNPQGQLDWVSKNCNYYIEKYISERLIK